jgi:hypothetical protein
MTLNFIKISSIKNRDNKSLTAFCNKAFIFKTLIKISLNKVCDTGGIESLFKNNEKLVNETDEPSRAIFQNFHSYIIFNICGTLLSKFY